MEPLSLALTVGAAVAVGTTLLVGITSLLWGDDRERQIKHRAKDARRQMDQTSREYLRDVDHLLRRKR